ncbi:Haloacetate dehalogenase H-like protein [Emericellopsis cladophorae]|uniref:Haloacetate dehalogenase H-like protein n=1 Tax=Emericellopsis cladophorae TaxID=2686198 RepID=A0A9P9Y6J9_9HYPO|nr:Haloacetate dehalogenase H-like protein [Emericellopsis cladophorae]KAI6784407.1 Haloacetate dehalogenase H-like protein [Emericellopsis cladophorae]
MSSTAALIDADWQPKAIVFDLLTALLDSWTLLPRGTYMPYEDCVRQAAQDVGLPASAPDALIRDWANLRAWPEVARVLPQLRRKGYKLGVVTNCSLRLGTIATQCAEATASTGVRGRFTFDSTMAAEESGFYKPTRAAYYALLSKMGLEASNVLFVAGSAGAVQGATDAGMRVVWHNKVGLPKKGSADPVKEAAALQERAQ